MVTYIFSCLYTKSSYKNVNKKSLVMLMELNSLLCKQLLTIPCFSLAVNSILFRVSYLLLVQPFRVSNTLNERKRIY
jgi:hypothetical protein